ncbi:unnamed protein product [Parnassius mnemosyne]|uniref:Uncharacterized protein n=1 Tax=Parnassius mnemosyne TaxID=213953 RepID=A0AAV1M2P7_9NEOP
MPGVLVACYHDPFQQTQWRGAWAGGLALGGATLHARGCVEAVRAPLARALLALQLFNMLVLLLQLVIVALTQLLRAALRGCLLEHTSSHQRGDLVSLYHLYSSSSWPVKAVL